MPARFLLFYLLCLQPYWLVLNRVEDLALAFAASTSRVRGSEVVTRERIRMLAEDATSFTARSKTALFALEGALNPLSFLTNCSDASRISASVAGGLKLNSVLMFLHM
jgi:hypothetical protein